MLNNWNDLVEMMKDYEREDFLEKGEELKNYLESINNGEWWIEKLIDFEMEMYNLDCLIYDNYGEESDKMKEFDKISKIVGYER